MLTAYSRRPLFACASEGFGGGSLEQQPSLDETVSIGPGANWCAMIKAPVEPIPRELRDQRTRDDQTLRPANEQLLQPDKALLPKDPFASGKTLELACHIKLDVELVARRFLPEVLF